MIQAGFYECSFFTNPCHYSFDTCGCIYNVFCYVQKIEAAVADGVEAITIRKWAKETFGQETIVTQIYNAALYCEGIRERMKKRRELVFFWGILHIILFHCEWWLSFWICNPVTKKVYWSGIVTGKQYSAAL